MAETATNILRQYMSSELVVFLISMLPILELRGGLVAASILDIPWRQAAIISVIGNILPIPIILLFVKQVLEWLSHTRLFSRMARSFQNKAALKGAEIMEKYPRRVQFALFLFVAIPLPGTGAWTGSLVASFLNIPIRRSFPSIFLGVITACFIMLTLAYALPALFGLK